VNLECIVVTEAGEPLVGPGSRGRIVSTGDGPDAVTGGGLVAILDPVHGLRGVQAGRTKLHPGLQVLLDGTAAPDSQGVLLGAGGWERVVPLAGGASWSAGFSRTRHPGC
jgi:hypothetical protein